MTDLSTSTNFYFLNQKFEVIHKLTQYESLMWVDKYDEPGNFEIYLPPTEEIKMAAQIDNYFMSDKSEHLMIIEKLETTVSPENGERLVVSGRSLESILDRRVIFLKTYFTNKKDSETSNEPVIGSDNLEDALRQLLDATFISPKTKGKINHLPAIFTADLDPYGGGTTVYGVNFVFNDTPEYAGKNVIKVERTSSSSSEASEPIIWSFNLDSSGDYILSGIPSGTEGLRQRMWYIDETVGIVDVAIDTGDGARFTANKDTNYYLAIIASPEFTGSCNVFPMVRKSNVIDDTYVPSNVEEGDIIDWDRKLPNFIFQYSDDDQPITDSNDHTILDSNGNPIIADAVGDYVSAIELKDCEFDIGDNVLNIVNTIVKSTRLGYKITLDSNHSFVFSLYKGLNRTSSQLVNPAVIFSPKFNNIKNTKFTFDSGENFRNFVYTEGEAYKNAAPTIVKTGEETGLLRREVYVTAESVHETEAVNVTHSAIQKTKKKLTEEEYQTTLAEEATKYFKSFAAKTTLESEVEPRLTFQYGRDFHIGDILEVQDGTGNKGEIRCVEFIISHSASGYEEYPTFKNVTDEEETPSQTTASGGEFTDEGSNPGGGSGGGGEGHTYDVEMNATNDKMTLTEDGSNKTTLPLVGTFVGSRAEWNALSATDKAKYRILHFNDETASVFSHVGQIIESTTLDTEAKVKAIYGSNTSWIQHTGYMLRGASSSVTANHTGNDGGADSVTVSSVANHNHTQNQHGHYVTSNSNQTTSGMRGVYADYSGTGSGSYIILTRAVTPSPQNPLMTTYQTATNNANGANYTVNTLPKYKNVYIWERVS